MVTGALPRSGPGVIEFPRGAGSTLVLTRSGRISLTMHRSIEPAATVWKAFEVAGSSPVTHAQSFESARAWYEQVSRPKGNEPLIVIGRSESGQLLFLLPFEIVTRFGLRTLQWVAQETANYNMGLYEQSFAETADKSDMKGLLKSVVQMTDGVSLADFRNQPAVWDGMPNPMARLPHQISPNCGYAALLDPDFETFYRNRFSGRTRNSLRRKERKLGNVGKIVHGWAKSPQECRSMLATFYDQKSSWFRKQGISDPFSAPEYKAYFEQLSLLPEGTSGRLELGYLRVGDEVAATYNGATINGRFHLLLSSIALADTDRWSPGILLLRHQIREMCRRGCHHYDLGTGLAQHKSEWADEQVQLFDTFLAFDEAGYVVKVPLSLASAAKRKIKNSPVLWGVTKAVRRLLSGSGSPAPLAEH